MVCIHPYAQSHLTLTPTPHTAANPQEMIPPAQVLRHGRDVHPAWVNVVTAALALKLFGGQVTRAEVMLESREGSGFLD
jgi:hypothetical protein